MNAFSQHAIAVFVDMPVGVGGEHNAQVFDAGNLIAGQKTLMAQYPTHGCNGMGLIGQFKQFQKIGPNSTQANFTSRRLLNQYLHDVQRQGTPGLETRPPGTRVIGRSEPVVVRIRVDFCIKPLNPQEIVSTAISPHPGGPIFQKQCSITLTLQMPIGTEGEQGPDRALAR